MKRDTLACLHETKYTSLTCAIQSQFEIYRFTARKPVAHTRRTFGRMLVEIKVYHFIWAFAGVCVCFVSCVNANAHRTHTHARGAFINSLKQ